jgi:5-methylcytosine-specific restriction protein A
MPTSPPVHRPVGYQSRADRRTRYNRDHASERGGAVYTYRWQKLRSAFLTKHPLCTACDHIATVVDHIRPHRGDQVLMWSWDNLQAMCKPCHDRKTATEDGGFARRR